MLATEGRMCQKYTCGISNDGEKDNANEPFANISSLGNILARVDKELSSDSYELSYQNEKLMSESDNAQ